MIRVVIGDHRAWEGEGTAVVQTAIALGELDDLTLTNIAQSTFFAPNGIADMATREITRRQVLES